MDGRGKLVKELEEQREAAARERAEQQVSSVSNLSPKERIFLIEFLTHGNRTRAAKAAGYAHPDRAGSRLAKSDKIRNAVDEFFHQEQMGAAEAVQRLSQQARADYANYLIFDPISQETRIDMERLLKDGKGHLIKKIGWTRTGQDSAEQVVEFYDAFQALVYVGRYHNLFNEKPSNVQVTLDLTQLDYTKLTDEQVEALQRGDDPVKVLLGGYLAK